MMHNIELQPLGRVRCANRFAKRTLRRRGFTFTEVMFAVILLGIGFIMLAGMFPVAIQQTQTNVEESTASVLVQAATRYLEESLTQADLQPTGNLGSGIYPRFLRLSQRCDTGGNPLPDKPLWEKAS